MHKTAIVIGAGIAGLAIARALAIRKYDVKVIEKNGKAVGASIRNFGMIWPIGQPDGELYERALLSRSIWKEICSEANIWHEKPGSLHVAHSAEEWKVLQELTEVYKDRNYCLLSKEETVQSSPHVVEENLFGSMFSQHEMIVDPREAIVSIPAYLEEKYGVEFYWGNAATEISYPSVFAGNEEYQADEIYVCSGADFETLYPSFYGALPLTKCKLQMMRMAAQPARIGPALCGGLSLAHYKSFTAAASLNDLKKYFEDKYAEYLQWGIHVMISQNRQGELTVGDSHEYGLDPVPFDKTHINQLILDYLKTFARFHDETIIETWNGVYPKSTTGATELVFQPEEGVTIINGLSGAGMTLSFGLCEQIASKKFTQPLSQIHFSSQRVE